MGAEYEILRENGGVAYVIGGSDDVEVVGAGAGGVAAEDDVGAVELERVVKRVENLRGDELPRHEDVGALKRRRLEHLGRAPPWRFWEIELGELSNLKLE